MLCHIPGKHLYSRCTSMCCRRLSCALTTQRPLLASQWGPVGPERGIRSMLAVGHRGRENQKSEGKSGRGDKREVDENMAGGILLYTVLEAMMIGGLTC